MSRPKTKPAKKWGRRPPMRFWYVKTFEGKASVLWQRQHPGGRYIGRCYRQSIYGTIYPGEKTLKASRQKWCMPKEPCRICGDPFPATFFEETKNRMLAKNICFTCDFWTEIQSAGPKEDIVIVDGNHYTICPDNGAGHWSGFGGREFKIRFNDGRERTTRNLWHQGDIPPQFLQALPNNAQFV
jgi:hypothetical protein